MDNQKLFYKKQYDNLLADLVLDHTITFDDIDDSNKRALTTYLLKLERNPVALFCDSLGGSDILATVLQYLTSTGAAQSLSDLQAEIIDLINDSGDIIFDYYRDKINEDLSDALEIYLGGLEAVHSDISYQTHTDYQERARSVADWC